MDRQIHGEPSYAIDAAEPDSGEDRKKSVSHELLRRQVSSSQISSHYTYILTNLPIQADLEVIMEKAKALLMPHPYSLDVETKLFIHPQQSDSSSSRSFYESFTIHGLHIQKLEPGHVLCRWKVPARLTDASGSLQPGAIANIVDDVGAAASLSDGQPEKVSVDMNISYLSNAKVNDEIEINARVLGHKGGFSMTQVELRNKSTGKLVAEGRHSLYSRWASKL